MSRFPVVCILMIIICFSALSVEKEFTGLVPRAYGYANPTDLAAGGIVWYLVDEFGGMENGYYLTEYYFQSARDRSMSGSSHLLQFIASDLTQPPELPHVDDSILIEMHRGYSGYAGLMTASMITMSAGLVIGGTGSGLLLTYTFFRDWISVYLPYEESMVYGILGSTTALFTTAFLTTFIVTLVFAVKNWKRFVSNRDRVIRIVNGDEPSFISRLDMRLPVKIRFNIELL
jgi:hypothetical protein